MNESLKMIFGILAIFALGIFVGYFLQPQPDYNKIDQLNANITTNLTITNLC